VPTTGYPTLASALRGLYSDPRNPAVGGESPALLRPNHQAFNPLMMRTSGALLMEGISCCMDLELIPAPPTIFCVRDRMVTADKLGRIEDELAEIVRATQEVLAVRNRLMGYALTVGDWPALN
jgi:hypothetical protein